MTRKDLSELYCWIRKNNQHTPDEVVDFMYQAAIEKFDKEQNERDERERNDRLYKEYRAKVEKQNERN